MNGQSKARRPGWLRLPRRRSARAALAIVATALVVVPIAMAFDDVPGSSPHFADINTIARVGITTGCNPPANNLYCPSDSVRRDQMASFIARTLRAVTPVYLTVEGPGGAVDFDADPVVCATPAHTAAVAEAAFVHSWFSAVSSTTAGASSWQHENVVSTNNGATWVGLDGNFGRGGRDVVNEWGTSSSLSVTNLVAGTSYRFAIRLHREAGTSDATNNRCETIAQLTYRDAGVSALGAGTPIAPLNTHGAELGPR